MSADSAEEFLEDNCDEPEGEGAAVLDDDKLRILLADALNASVLRISAGFSFSSWLKAPGLAHCVGATCEGA